MDCWLAVWIRCKVALFQIFFGLSALCLSVILDFHFIYAVSKPTMSEDIGVIYGLASP